MSEETVRVGVQLTDDGIAFFGTEEVNELLGRGWKVTRVEPDEPTVEEIPSGDADEEPEYALVGFSVQVQLRSAE